MTLVLAAALLGGCSRPPVHVSGPFYVGTLAETNDVYLIRCPHGPDEGCAVDGLPGPRIVAAGANGRYIVVAQAGDSDDQERRYFYFARVPQEVAGWGNNPERIVGPLTQAEFDKAAHDLHLPPLTIRR
ncbi:MAG TPA: hypothetical protein VGL66_13530 [Caulobacteraceae bacterium]|jgi:hypothetical protein